uniref:PPPDE domain-containing protein n=1 Tax=Chromera velia CCMP2878 TaxID=1169474 RepID=A0A0G4FI26_9ALVE|mmetsp:Transcript_49286/g.97112  ORF Transcript_49286/g.97112 Transcript_49286/m.97112 type:complete len:231 (-) Transcript_49286:108-800(-)|eukprot:Cvel_3368.t1-p1 / transcript=Cvel_3368.t1 / gene=Cvel_3368 / organism=Chromera_velia_CCMP2878 / gene_product=hypothetical protein / transcript_product=hypothetical protein / location=Cvel_scaffold134:116518-121993(-) / protein_length=230 / sequence_SO=supercontig / SO=protein_coding / is_pseudo=false
MGANQTSEAPQGAPAGPSQSSASPPAKSGSTGRIIDPAKAKNKVQLAATVLGGIPPFQAYHTSVVVNGEEYFFDMGGVETTRNLGSHQQANQAGQKTAVIDMGMSDKSGSDVLLALRSHFGEGSYDLVRKNCNSFSDCALFYLLGKRLDGRYKQLERMGAANPGLLAQVTGGEYKPNPKAEGFDIEKVIDGVDPEKVWKTPGHATGGEVVSDKEEMRRKRLAALQGVGAS